MNAIYQYLGIPFGYLLRWIYYSVGFENYAISIVLLTLFARLLMVPSTISQQKGQAKMQRLNAKIRKIQTKYAGDQRKIQEETQALYQREGYNPMSAGCMPMLVQFLLLFGLIGAIYYPLRSLLPDITETQKQSMIEGLKTLMEQKAITIKSFNEKSLMNELYILKFADELQHLGIEGVSDAVFNSIKNLGFNFFGLFSLGDVPMEDGAANKLIWIIPVLSFLSSFGTGIYSQIHQKKTNPTAKQNAAMMGCMSFGMPLMSLFFVVRFPVGIGIYWIASSVFGFLSTVLIGHFYSPAKMIARIMVDETVERRSREEVIKRAAANKE